MSSMATAIRYKFIIDGLISATRRILYVHKSKLYLDGTIESRFAAFINLFLDLYTFVSKAIIVVVKILNKSIKQNNAKHDKN